MFGFRNKKRRAEHAAHIKIGLRIKAQYLLRKQNADHMVPVPLINGITRVRFIQNERDDGLRPVCNIHRIHLSARHHTSRAHKLAIWKTPSIIDKDSVSIRLRAWASFRISSASSRDAGFERMS